MAWLTGWSKRKKITLTGGSSGAQTDYQLKLTVTYDSDMQSDFDDLRFTKADGTLIDAWLESKIDNTSAIVWVEFPTTPANTVTEDYYMYYGNVGAASDWDGAATFLQYHGAASSDFLDSLTIPPISAYKARVRTTNDAANVHWGITNDNLRGDDNLEFGLKKSNNTRYFAARNDSHETYLSESGVVTNQWYIINHYNDGSIARGYVDGNEVESGITTNLPDENMGLWLHIYDGAGEQDWSFVHKYAANPATYGFGSEESEPSTGNPYWYYNMLKRRNS